MAFILTDDGTMDTVVRCEHCGEEVRFNYDPTGNNPEPRDYDTPKDIATRNEQNRWLYDAWVAECIEDAKGDHECKGH